MIFDLILLALILAWIGLSVTDRRVARRLGDIVVTTSQGDSLRGHGRRGFRCVYLDSVKLLGNSEQEISGTFEIPRRHVVMLQRLPAPAAPLPTKARPTVHGESG